MVNMENYEEYMLLEADGELGEAERKVLYAFLEQHPELLKEMEMYMATKPVPDTQMVFANKEQLLKKQGGSTIAFGGRWMYAAAACVAALIAIIMWKRLPSTNETNTIVKTDNTINTIAKSPVVYDTAKEFHSQPGNPVAIENKTPVKQKRTVQKHQPTLMPVVQEEKLAHEVTEKIVPEIKQEIPQPITAIPEQKVQTDVTMIASNEEVKVPIVAEEPEPEKREALAWLPIKKEGLNVLAEVVNEKIEKIKEVRNSLKDTDVSFRIGNKELFIVRL